MGDQESFSTQPGGEGIEEDFLEKGMPNLKPVGETGTRQKKGEQDVGARLREELV